MGTFIDITGESYGKLKVIRPTESRDSNGVVLWLCQCDCGNLAVKSSVELRRNKRPSCGCTQHGQSYSSTYHTWSAMLQRCTNPKNHKYPIYGARGITVCEEWKEFPSFLADMGERPKGLTLERKDNDKGYYKDNCYWATRKAQQNNRRACHTLTFGGKEQTIQQWADELKIPSTTITARLKYGWSTEDTLTRPIQGKLSARHSKNKKERVNND